MAGCAVTFTWDHHPPSLPLRTNAAMTGRWVQAQRRRGRDPLPLGVVSTTLAASTDFGNVSFRVPGVHPVIQLPPHELSLHARPAAAGGAYGLAATVLDVQHDVRLAEAVAAEFTAAG